MGTHLRGRREREASYGGLKLTLTHKDDSPGNSRGLLSSLVSSMVTTFGHFYQPP